MLTSHSSSIRKETGSLDFGGGLAVIHWALLVALSAASGCVDFAPELRVGAVIVDSCSGVADGALCNDQNSCTVGDSCQAGICVGTAAVDGTACTDGNQCTGGDTCAQGVCTASPVPDGVPCTDGEPCTDPDTCRGGQCLPGPPRVCDDGNACTIDQCVVRMGCRFDPTPTCPDGSVTDAPSDAPSDGTSDVDVSPPPDGPDPDSGGPDLPGGPDVTAGQDADAPVDVDAAGDADDAGGDADGPVGPDADGAVGIDMAGEVGIDAPVVDRGADSDDDATADGRDAEGGVDAGSDAAQDASEDAVDAVDAAGPDSPTNLFEARGGACVCEIGDASRPSGAMVGLAAIGLIITIRRCRRRPRGLRNAQDCKAAKTG